MLDHNEEPGEVLSSDENDEQKTDVMSNSINQSQRGAAEKKKAPHFPLRVRKNQQFAKGPDCASIPSSRTPAVDKLNAVDDPETSEQPQVNSNEHKSLLSSRTQDNCSFSEMPSNTNTFQDDILREYET